jgi:hypothetical protein
MKLLLMLLAGWFLVPASAAAQVKIDMKANPLFKKQLDTAADSIKKNLVKETNVAGVPVRINLGNEGGVSVKSAVLEVEKKFPLAGKAKLVFDLHFRQVVTKEREETVLGRKVKIPAVIAYDRHEELVVEYDIREKKAKAHVLKGPFSLPPLPKQDYEVWVEIDLREKK